MMNLERLRGFTDADGQRVPGVELPLPRMRVEFDGHRLPLTYANFYIANGGVIVPVYGDANDARALDILRPLFPEPRRARRHGAPPDHGRRRLPLRDAAAAGRRRSRATS